MRFRVQFVTKLRKRERNPVLYGVVISKVISQLLRSNTSNIQCLFAVLHELKFIPTVKASINGQEWKTLFRGKDIRGSVGPIWQVPWSYLPWPLIRIPRASLKRILVDMPWVDISSYRRPISHSLLYFNWASSTSWSCWEFNPYVASLIIILQTFSRAAANSIPSATYQLIHRY